MGLTNQSTGKKAADGLLSIQKNSDGEKTVALFGNPNVGKSTVFNQLTGLRQHTGNWPGKTVASAYGETQHHGNVYRMVDLPGTYSLLANSVEEEVARDFLCYGNADAAVVVADATCLERNLNLVLQTLEITGNVVLCINLMDEAKRKGIVIDLALLSRLLGVPVVGTDARRGGGLIKLMDAVEKVAQGNRLPPLAVRYEDAIEQAIAMLEPLLQMALQHKLNARWAALRMLEEETFGDSISKAIGIDLLGDEAIARNLTCAKALLNEHGYDSTSIRDALVLSIIAQAQDIARQTVVFEKKRHDATDRKLDRILTSKAYGIPAMLLLLALVFWITITGANAPSQALSRLLFLLQDKLTALFVHIGAPAWLHGALILGIYRTLAWVVSVMLPPMAIFFPLFTLLEDAGYLPRVAFNLDALFKKARAHGKQALSMCMGFGCNAAGVIGCRIIDSPRERLIAIITNNFVPCNGRFPTLIAMITMFFTIPASGIIQSGASALLLTLVIVLGIGMTFVLSGLLSKTVLKGLPSSFTLELPPYRRPQLGKVIVRSVFDRTLFVLSRAVSVAAPAGLVIWCMANIQVGNASLLMYCANFFDPFARLLGLDGVILMAFVLGFPANEIVLPIIIMCYMSTGSILSLASLGALKVLLVSHGWTWLTALCTMLFSLMHFPCATTCLTILKETRSLKWTGVSMLVPTITGMMLCFLTATAARLLGFA